MRTATVSVQVLDYYVDTPDPFVLGDEVDPKCVPAGTLLLMHATHPPMVSKTVDAVPVRINGDGTFSYLADNFAEIAEQTRLSLDRYGNGVFRTCKRNRDFPPAANYVAAPEPPKHAQAAHALWETARGDADRLLCLDLIEQTVEAEDRIGHTNDLEDALLALVRGEPHALSNALDVLNRLGHVV